jgi:hypothetical protein
MSRVAHTLWEIDCTPGRVGDRLLVAYHSPLETVAKVSNTVLHETSIDVWKRDTRGGEACIRHATHAFKAALPAASMAIQAVTFFRNTHRALCLPGSETPLPAGHLGLLVATGLHVMSLDMTLATPLVVGVQWGPLHLLRNRTIQDMAGCRYGRARFGQRGVLLDHRAPCR